MADRPPLGPDAGSAALLAEIARQNKVIEALVNRLERNANGVYRSEFEQLQSTVVLKSEVRRRTADLEIALRDNERMTRELRESEFKLLTVINQPLVGIATSEAGRFTFVNQKLADIFGYAAEELIGRDVLELVADCDKAMVAEQLRQRLSSEVPVAGYSFHGLRKDGVEIDVELHGSVEDAGRRPVAVAVMLDITQRRTAERRAEELQAMLREQSIRDPLTGLFNRRYLDTGLDRLTVRSRAEDGTFSVVMGDVDHFKAINDRFGHQAGDAVLVAIADLIARRCGPDDLAVRYGGEEFLIVLARKSGAMARLWADDLRQELQSLDVERGGAIVRVTASFGVASFPVNGHDWPEVTRAADNALYAAKRGGRNQVRLAPAQAWCSEAAPADRRRSGGG